MKASGGAGITRDAMLSVKGAQKKVGTNPEKT